MVTKPDIFWLTTIALSATGAAQSWGHARCPCATPEQVGDHSYPGLPKDFGLGCAQHELVVARRYSDANASLLPEEVQRCRGPRPEQWCFDNWCYVKPSNCSVSSAQSSEYYPGLLYSSATCGSLDSWQSTLLSSALQNETVRVALLSNTGGWKGSYACTSTGCTGPTFDFWTAVGAAAGVNAQIDNWFGRSGWDWSKELPFPEPVMMQVQRDIPTMPGNRSLFTACVYAAGMGYIDICIGSFTITDERASISNMIEVYRQEVYLVTRQQVEDDSKSTNEWFMAAFLPFSGELWGVFVGCVVLVSVLLVLHEHVFGGEASEFHGQPLWKKFLLSFYEAMLSAWSGGGTTFEPSTPGGRITVVAFAFWILLFTAAYTAKMASFLVIQSKPVNQYQSLDDLPGDVNLCMDNTLREPLSRKTTFPLSRMVGMINRSWVLSNASEGRQCTAAVMVSEDLESAYAAAGDSDLCQFTKVGEPLFSVPQGAPVSSHVFRTLLQKQLNVTQQGLWETLMATSTPLNKCKPAATNQDPQTQSLPVEAMTGPLIVTGVVCAFSVLLEIGLYLFGRFRRRQQLSDTWISKVAEDLCNTAQEVAQDVFCRGSAHDDRSSSRASAGEDCGPEDVGVTVLGGRDRQLEDEVRDLRARLARVEERLLGSGSAAEDLGPTSAL